ncbi:hypothetical protein VTN00DRAFT_6742 [Thermoascus crustaceus]|uniref:uncharacterized protein n=1 Tax=Thermoascus crustaceus TaxID=5088 RepID=UPI003743E4A1
MILTKTKAFQTLPILLLSFVLSTNAQDHHHDSSSEQNRDQYAAVAAAARVWTMTSCSTPSAKDTGFASAEFDLIPNRCERIDHKLKSRSKTKTKSGSRSGSESESGASDFYGFNIIPPYTNMGADAVRKVTFYRSEDCTGEVDRVKRIGDDEDSKYLVEEDCVGEKGKGRKTRGKLSVLLT